MNTDIPQEILNYFSGCAHKCAEAGLLSCSSGNLSLRLPELSGDSGLALLSATGSWLEELREDQVALCRISNGRCLNGVQRWRPAFTSESCAGGRKWDASCTSSPRMPL